VSKIEDPKKVTDIKLVQCLEPFSLAWKKHQMNSFLKIHMKASRGLGLRRSDASFSQYMQVKSLSNKEMKTEKTLSNAFSYDMLLNMGIAASFAYVPVYLKDRLSYIPSPDYEGHIDTTVAKKCQSDYVRFIVDFAQLPEKEAREMQLTTKNLIDRVERRKKRQDSEYED